MLRFAIGKRLDFSLRPDFLFELVSRLRHAINLGRRGAKVEIERTLAQAGKSFRLCLRRQCRAGIFPA
jgi:hypothetical protein